MNPKRKQEIREQTKTLVQGVVDNNPRLVPTPDVATVRLLGFLVELLSEPKTPTDK